MDARKLEKKLRRKQAQISVKLPKWNISFSDEPTQYVYVGNGGIQTGVSHKLLKSVLCEDAVSIHMIPSMDFAFVVFKNKEVSMRTLENLNGSCVQQLVEDKCLQELVPATLLSGPPIHFLMAYVYELPPQLSVQQCNAIERELPPGCHILYEFVSEGEEQKLLQYFSKHDKLIDSPGQLVDEDLIETNTNVLKCDVSPSNTCSNATPKKVNTVALPVQCDSKGSDLSIIDMNKERKSGVTSASDMYMCHNTSEASISVDRILSVDHIKKPIDMESTNNVSLSENESLVVYKTLKPDVPMKYSTDYNIPSQLNVCDTSDKDKYSGHNKHFTKLKPDAATKHNTDHNIPSQLNVCDTGCSSHIEHVTNPIYTHLKLRTVHHYGYEFLYGINTVDPSRPLPGGIPKICDFLLDGIQRTGLVAYSPDQLTVNKYLPGAGIVMFVCMYIFFLLLHVHIVCQVVSEILVLLKAGSHNDTKPCVFLQHVN